MPHARGGPSAAPAGAALEAPRPAPIATATVELDALFDDSSLRLPEVALEPHPSGAEPTPRPDTGQPGRGGEQAARRPALNLADRDDEIALSKDVQSRVDRSQVQRLRVAADRASRDDRRATLEPMELTFLASGDGSWHERRPLAADDPSRGARAAAPPSLEGANAGGPARPPEGPLPPSPLGNARLGNRQASTGVGLLHGEAGPRHHQSADVAFGRPLVTQGRPAVPANVNDKPRDNVESVQEVASNEQSLLHASTAGGEPAPAGRGGEQGPEATGAGGPEGPGSRATPLGQGQGPLVDLDGSDPRLSDYHRRLLAKIHPLWANAFPRWAALEGLQGLAIIQFTVLADGSITGVRVLRPSGVPEFDENVRRAVLRAAPFAPLPANFNARSVNFKITFDSPNPAVR
ncbi:MAG TPA: energy transducer TonB [Polyangiaceae bacterium]|nr:energy transducer TonB [Polyangiaceae bacterium]